MTVFVEESSEKLLLEILLSVVFSFYNDAAAGLLSVAANVEMLGVTTPANVRAQSAVYMTFYIFIVCSSFGNAEFNQQS